MKQGGGSPPPPPGPETPGATRGNGARDPGRGDTAASQSLASPASEVLSLQSWVVF